MVTTVVMKGKEIQIGALPTMSDKRNFAVQVAQSLNQICSLSSLLTKKVVFWGAARHTGCVR